MKRVVETGLAEVSAPFSWATVGHGILFTAQIPFDERGALVAGDVRAQTGQCLRNLARTVRAAGGGMADVTQVVVFLTDGGDFAAMNEAYRQHFAPPYPNRATVMVAGLAVPGMRVEMLAYAAVGGRRAATRSARPAARAGRSSASRRRKAGRRSSR
jgi:enamine deaminase RidA (YjgF/YER057c/UK114 family)